MGAPFWIVPGENVSAAPNNRAATMPVTAAPKTRSGAVAWRIVHTAPATSVTSASPIRATTITGLPVFSAVVISAIACQPRMPVPAARARIVTSRPRADRIRIRTPMLAMA